MLSSYKGVIPMGLAVGYWLLLTLVTTFCSVGASAL